MTDELNTLAPTTPRSFALARNGLPARIVLAILTSAGILYANVVPVIVSGLAASANFSSDTAGYVFSLNMYGSSIGGFVIIFLVARLKWRPIAAALLALLIAADLLSTTSETAISLYAIRFVHGLAGGALIGVGLSVIARTANPERTIALMLFVQLSLGGVGVAMLTPLIPSLGVGIVWLSMVGFSALALLLLSLLDAYAVHVAPERSIEASGGRAPRSFIALALVSIFLYQSGQMGAFAYVIELGNHYRFATGFISVAIAVALWIGGPAALLVAWWSTRSGRLRPAFLGIVLTAAVIAAMAVPLPAAYLLANIGLSISFSLSIPYLFGVASEMDNNGQTAAFAGFVSSLGLASGPAMAGMILGEAHFERIIILAVVLLSASAVLVVHPARMLDRINIRGRVTW